MKNKIGKFVTYFSLSAFMVMLALTAGCSNSRKSKGKFTDEEMAKLPAPQRTNLPAPSGGLVLSVNGETLSAEEIISPATQILSPNTKGKDINAFAEEAAPVIQNIVRDRITTILLYQRAKVSISERMLEEDGPVDKAVDKEIQRFVANYGGDYSKAQKAIEESGFDWQSFREYKKKMIITQSFFADELEEPKPITHSELIETYNLLKEENFKLETKREFQIIQFDTDKNLEDTKALARRVMLEAKAGKDFTELVKKYSVGPKADSGGTWQTSGPGSLTSPYDIIEQEAELLEQDQVTDVIEVNGDLYIAKLTLKQNKGYVPFEQVQGRIEARLIDIKRQRQTETVLMEMLREANIGGIEGFMEYCLRQAYIRINTAS